MKPLARRLLRAALWILLIAAIVWGGCLYFFHTPLPPVGIYIALLAFFAALVTILPPEGRWSKAGWVFLFAMLAGFEVHNLYRDRTQHDREQKEARKLEDDRFDGILKRNQTHFDATINSMKKLWSETTGGGSYIYFDLGAVDQQPLESDVPGAHKGEIITNAWPKFVGIYPLHNVFVAGSGPMRWLRNVDYGTIFPKEFGSPEKASCWR